ncbi:hypothetical protein ACFV3R_21875 [Streptomyces sp. NPDC059740]|uniref:hypothetical protein n=1 Tax=Streptomyces sp. NPDC059740 TaxID=3346926 RepID=UPI00365ADFEE
MPADPTVQPAEQGDHVPTRRGRVASLAARLTPGASTTRRDRGAGGPEDESVEHVEDVVRAERRRRVRLGLGSLADRIIELAPRVPVRDLATLRRQFPDRTPEEIADRLVAGAARATATVGAGVGAAAMLPTPPAMPAELAAEVIGIASVEIKLIAELHEVYGLRPDGGLRRRSLAYLSSWTEERGIEVTRPSSLNAALGSQTRRRLRQQILKRTFRKLPALAPFMIGATVGAVLNRRDTRTLAEKVRADLRRHQVPWDALPAERSGSFSEDGPGQDGPATSR